MRSAPTPPVFGLSSPHPGGACVPRQFNWRASIIRSPARIRTDASKLAPYGDAIRMAGFPVNPVIGYEKGRSVFRAAFCVLKNPGSPDQSEIHRVAVADAFVG